MCITELFDKATLPLYRFRTDVQAILQELGRVKNNHVSPFEHPEDIHIAVMCEPGIYSIFIPGFSHELVSLTPVRKLISPAL